MPRSPSRRGSTDAEGPSVARAAHHAGLVAILAVGSLVAIVVGGSTPDRPGELPTSESSGQSGRPVVPNGIGSTARPSSGPVSDARCDRIIDADPTGATDVTSAVQSFIEASPDSSVVCFQPRGDYRIEGQLHLAHRSDLTVEGRGARIFATTRSAVPRLLIDRGGSGIVVRDLTIEGYWPEAGTPEAVIDQFEGNHGIAIGGTADVEVGPDVHIRDVGGDGLYLTAGGSGAEIAWATGVHLHDSTVERTGRNGVAITDGAREVTIEDNRFDAIALHVFDIEPNGYIFRGVPAGAETVRFSNNTIGTFGLSTSLVTWLFAGAGRGPQTDVEVSRNLVTGGALRIGVWNVEGTGRSEFRITDNWSQVTVPGPTMVFEGVDGLTVSGNTQPLSMGVLMAVRDTTMTVPPD